VAARHTGFQAIGTKWLIEIDDSINDTAWMQLVSRLHGRIEAFDKAYSRFRPDSLVTQISKKPGSYNLPADAYKLLAFYDRLYAATNGSVTPLIGQTMVEAGYDASYSLEKKKLHHPPEWEAVMSYDQNSIALKQPVLLDFGAAGKGYLVDILGEILEEVGIRTYMINAGGDIRYRSEHNQALEIGLENPTDVSEVIGITKLTNASLCASAGSKRKWDDINHIINPQTLQSPEHIIATWVVAADTMTADGLATALFFTEPQKLMQQFSFSYALLFDDMSLQSTKEFPITIFEAN
jgi:thiamine biosynthesis lipoprotein